MINQSTTNIIKINLFIDDLIKYYGEGNLEWATSPLDRMDIISFCRIDNPSPKNDTSQNSSSVLLLEAGQKYQFNLQLVAGKTTSNIQSDHQQITFNQTPEANPNALPWSAIFDDLNDVNGNSCTLKLLNDNGIHKTPEFSTSASLPLSFRAKYTITFDLHVGHIIRYCRIDPIIRTNSDDDGTGADPNK